MKSIALVFRAAVIVAIFASTLCGQTIARSVHGSNYLPLIMQGGVPSFSTTPASPIDLGPAPVGLETTPSGRSMLINNSGTAPLVVSQINFSSFDIGFTAETDFNPPQTIAAGASRHIDFLIFPQAEGLRTVQFASTDNAPGSPHMLQFTATGVAVPANDFALILDPGIPSTVSVPAGGTTTFLVWLLAGKGYSQNVATQCSAGSDATCSLTPNTSGLFGGAGQFTRDPLTVSVSSASGQASLRQGLPRLWWSMPCAAVLVLFWSRRRNSSRFGPAVALLLLAAFLISCGGHSSRGPTTLVITATTTSQVGGPSHTLTVPLAIR